MKKRSLPRHCDFLLEVATKAHLSHPLGRALYSCNRIQNGGGGFSIPVFTEDNETLTEKLSSIRPETAKRWLKHWNSGGSIKSLSHGSAGRIR